MLNFILLCFNKQLDYTFYGTYKLDIRCRQFFDEVQDQFLNWPEFSSENDERMTCARDGVEQYVMTRIAEYAFKSVVDKEGDELLSRRMKLLSFVRPEVSIYIHFLLFLSLFFHIGILHIIL